MTRFIARPCAEVRGRVRVASDKSISHRAFLLAALAKGTSVVHNPLDALDVSATRRAVQQLGARLREIPGGFEVDGNGIESLEADPGGIDCGNSGTLIRLLCGACAAGRVACTLDGDESLRARPMGRVTEPLAAMGAQIRHRRGKPPLRLRAARKLAAIEHRPAVASAQVKSAVLLAGLGAEGRTTVIEPAPSRDHTERMLGLFGCRVERDGAAVSLRGGQELSPAQVRVPADISSAAFFMVAAAIARKGEVLLEEVSLNPTRAGIVAILRLMGADISESNPGLVSGEPVASLAVRPSRLRGIKVPRELVASAIDEFPAIFVAAAAAAGTTSVRGAAELRVKESDRIAAMAAGLRALGVRVAEHPDGLDIVGSPGGIAGGSADSFGDHRVAMALAVAACASAGEVMVHNCANVATSFPQFGEQCRSLGIDLAADGGRG